MFALEVRQLIKTQVVELRPNKTMRKQLDNLCDYRRYCWNLALSTWQTMYDAHTLNKTDNPSPNERRVRDELVANKADWQFSLSARCLQLTVKDLAMLGRPSLIKLKLIGVSHSLNQRKILDKALKPIELR